MKQHKRTEIYFIRLHDFIKIGITNDITKRLTYLQSASPYELTIVRLLQPGTFFQEQWLHRHYTDRYIRNEWFTFDQSMLTITVPEHFTPGEKQDLMRSHPMRKAYFDTKSNTDITATLPMELDFTI